MGALVSTVQVASLYVEKIRLAFKIKRVRLEMVFESAIYNKKSPHIFSATNLSNFIISKFNHFQQLLSLQNLLTTYCDTHTQTHTFSFNNIGSPMMNEILS